MERLFYSILVGILVGFGGALWLPPHRLAYLMEVVDVVQAKAQSLSAESPATIFPGSPPMAPAQPTAAARPVSWPGARTETPPTRDGEATPDIDLIDYDAPPATGEGAAYAGDGGEAPPDAAAAPEGEDAGIGGFGGSYPRTDEGLGRTIEINQFEGAKIIARYGSEVVLANEVLPEIDRALSEFKGKVPDDEFEQQRMLLMQRNLKNLMPTKLVVLDAKQHIPAEGWKKVQEQLVEQFEKHQMKVLFERHQATSRSDLAAKLEKFGSSIELERRAWGERAMAQQWVQQQVKKEEEVTHEDIVAYYREHLTEYDFQARAKWEQLVVRFDRFPSKADAWREMARQGNLIVDGAPFADVAKQCSHGFTARKGGVHDWTTQGSLVSEKLDQALFTLPIGQLSAIIEDAQGFHIIRVTERHEAGRRPFEDVQVEIKDKIRQQRRSEQIEAYLARVVEQTKVWTVFDDPAAAAELTGRPAAQPR